MAVAAAGGRRRQQQPARLVLLLVLLLGALSLRAFPGAHAAFTCDGGSKTLPDAFMNDGYCDCPEDGADEPATSACSLARRDESFTCGKSADGLPHRLFPSRVGDRICDCCDGSDEAANFCPDVCEAQAQAFVDKARAEYAAVMDGWLTRNDMLAGVKTTLGEWEAEIVRIERSLAEYVPVVSRLKAYQRREEKAESWEKLAWLREQAHLKRQQQREQQQQQHEQEQEAAVVQAQEPPQEPEPEPEPVPTQEQDEESGEAAAPAGEDGAPVAQQMEPAWREKDDTSLRVRVLYDEEQGLNGVERVLQGMVASQGGRDVALKEYLAEQEAVEKGEKPAKAAPSVGSVLATGSLDPRDVVEMNLQALGALVLGPFKAAGWSFKVCLEELYGAMGWNWKDPFRSHTFHSSRHLQSAAEQEAAASPIARWWRETVAPTTVGWAVASFLQGPDAAVALLRPDTIEGAPERLEAALLHSALDKIQEEMGKMRDRAQELRDGLATAVYGPEHAFLAWQGKCFELQDREHKYEVCPFKEVKQGWTLVGKWAGWGARRPGADAGETVALNRPEDMGKSLFFNEGQQCWNGPKRSAAVALRCGAEDKVVEVSEPSVCVYDLVMETPLLCDDALLAQAEARLGALGVNPQDIHVTAEE